MDMTTEGRATMVVTDKDQLLTALANPGTAKIAVRGVILGVPSLRLAPGQTLAGEPGAEIHFNPGIDGLALTADNTVTSVGLHASPEQRAIFNDTAVPSLGRLRLAGIVTTGQVQILARDQVRSGHLAVDGLHVAAADVRSRSDRPKGYGVEVLQGAFTLWNMQTDAAVTITADLTGLSAGSEGAPVIGSGIFVSGAGFEGGQLQASRVETRVIHSDGKIPPGTPDRITGGIFTVYGVNAEIVRNLGPVTTYGPNDMVLDTWGTVERWVAHEKITSFGPSGIGFVNFGRVVHLRVDAPIETFGQGARGFNVYTGTVDLAEFDRVTTRADGAVGIQISQPVGRVHVRRGIETFGGTGQSLVKGVVVTLSAVALSIKPGGSAQDIVVEGGIRTHGAGVPPIEMQGSVEALSISGGLNAGGGFEHI